MTNPNDATKGVVGLTLDGVELPAQSEMQLVDDGATHQVQVVMG